MHSAADNAIVDCKVALQLVAQPPTVKTSYERPFIKVFSKIKINITNDLSSSSPKLQINISSVTQVLKIH